MSKKQTLILLAPRDAGHLLGLTTSAVIKLARNGQLKELRDSAGRRFFRPEDVQALIDQRAAKRAKLTSGRNGFITGLRDEPC